MYKPSAMQALQFSLETDDLRVAESICVGLPHRQPELEGLCRKLSVSGIRDEASILFEINKLRISYG